MVIDRKEDIFLFQVCLCFISSLFMFIQHFQPIKRYLWIIVARQNSQKLTISRPRKPSNWYNFCRLAHGTPEGFVVGF